MKEFTCYFRSILLFALIFSLFTSKEWDAKTLSGLTDRDFIIDTDNYINRSGPSYMKILDYIREIQTEKKFLVYIYFISSITPNYKTKGFLSTTTHIEKFVNDLAFYSENGNPEKDKNSIFIVFSIQERVNRIRTGENVKKILTNEKASYYLNSVRSYLKKSDYTGALEELMYRLNYRLTKNTFWEDFFDNFLVCLTLLGVFWFCCFYKNNDNYSPYVQDEVAESKLEKIKKISENNKDNVKFLDDNCIICLEEFTQEEKNRLLKKKNENENENGNIDTNNHIPIQGLNQNPNPYPNSNEIPIVNNLLIDYQKEEDKGNLNNKNQEKDLKSNLLKGKYF
jgi:hypothetical protein